MTLIKICSLLWGAVLLAQSSIPGNPRNTFELVPAASTNVTDTHTVSVVRTSGTVLTIGNGASATAPQTIRPAGPGIGEFYPRQMTSSLTLTSAAGGQTGTIFIYGVPVTGTGATISSMQVVVVSNLGGTLNCTGSITCTVVTNGTPLANLAKTNGVYLAAARMTAGAPATFDTGGVSLQGVGLNAWVRAISISNITASPVTVNIADGKGTLYLFGASIQANTTYEVPIGVPSVAGVAGGGEVFFERGVFVLAGTASAINVTVRWVQPRPVYFPAQP
jgi:hypothetical protein